MKVWIDQENCTGDGLCEEISPEVFVLLGDDLAYVCEGETVFANAKGNPQGAEGKAKVPNELESLVWEAADECQGECIHIEH